MIEDATIFRSKQQVLCDLAKALHFSPESLEANRQGRFTKDQSKNLAQRCVKPALLGRGLCFRAFPGLDANHR